METKYWYKREREMSYSTQKPKQTTIYFNSWKAVERSVALRGLPSRSSTRWHKNPITRLKRGIKSSPGEELPKVPLCWCDEGACEETTPASLWTPRSHRLQSIFHSAAVEDTVCLPGPRTRPENRGPWTIGLRRFLWAHFVESFLAWRTVHLIL